MTSQIIKNTLAQSNELTIRFTKGKLEIALKAFSKVNKDRSYLKTAELLKELGIPDEIINAARKQVEAERARQARNRTGPER